MKNLLSGKVRSFLVAGGLVLMLSGVLVGCDSLLGGLTNDDADTNQTDDTGNDGDGSGDSGSGELAAPTFSLERGQYVGAQTLEIETETDGAEIYYVYGYGDPVAEGQRYDGPLTIEETQVIGAVAKVNDDKAYARQYIAIFDSQEALDTGNQIANGNFDAGGAAWFFYDYAGGDNTILDATVADVDGDGDKELKISFTDDGSENWHIGTGFDIGFPIAEGDLWEIEFTAWLSDSYPTASRKFNVQFDSLGVTGAPFEHYFWEARKLTKEARTFTIPVPVYEQTGFSYPAARFAMNFGEFGGPDAATIYVDDVSVTPVRDPRTLDELNVESDAQDAILSTLQELEVNDAVQPFSTITTSNVTEYHLAFVDELELVADDYPDPSTFALPDLSILRGLRALRVDGLPLDDADIETIGSTDTLRYLNIYGSEDTGYELAFTQLDPLADVQDLSSLNMGGLLPVSVTEWTELVTPANFPKLDRILLRHSFEADSVTSADLTAMVDAVAVFVDAGTSFSEVQLSGTANAAFSQENVQTLIDEVWLPSADTLRSISFDPSDANNKQLETIGTLANLDLINAAGSDKITDFTPIADLPRMSYLELYATNFDDEDLAAISGLNSLRVLNMPDTQITDITPLQTLLDNGAFANDGLVKLDGNPQLDLSPDTANGDVLSALEAAGVDVRYEASQTEATATGGGSGSGELWGTSSSFDAMAVEHPIEDEFADGVFRTRISISTAPALFGYFADEEPFYDQDSIQFRLNIGVEDGTIPEGTYSLVDDSNEIGDMRSALVLDEASVDFGSLSEAERVADVVSEADYNSDAEITANNYERLSTGSVEVSRDGSDYTLTWDLSTEFDTEISGSYTGPIDLELGDPEITTLSPNETVVGEFVARDDWQAYAYSIDPTADVNYSVSIADEWSGYAGNADTYVEVYGSESATSRAGFASLPFIADAADEDKVETPFEINPLNEDLASSTQYLLIVVSSDNPGTTSYEITVTEELQE